MCTISIVRCPPQTSFDWSIGKLPNSGSWLMLRWAQQVVEFWWRLRSGTLKPAIVRQRPDVYSIRAGKLGQMSGQPTSQLLMEVEVYLRAGAGCLSNR
jgi:hypothetical protein